jgi:hypothetical protein
MSKFVKENDIKLPLTEKELEQFGSATAFPLNDGECFVCSKRTVWVDSIHFVHICSEECMKAIDKRYEEGKGIFRNDMYKHIEEYEFNLMMDFMDQEKSE